MPTFILGIGSAPVTASAVISHSGDYLIQLLLSPYQPRKARSLKLRTGAHKPVVCGTRYLNCDLVFHKNGRPYTPHDIRAAHESTCKKAGIDGFVFHDFRHTCINDWRKEGHDYFKIMAVSGHKTISVFKRYNMVNEDELRTLISPIGTSVGTKGEIQKQKEVSTNV